MKLTLQSCSCQAPSKAPYLRNSICFRVPWTARRSNQSWIFIGRTDAEAETPILWPPDAKNWLIGKDPDVGKDLKAGGEGDDRGWDGWMASLTQWTWVWVGSGRWCWTGPGMLQSMGSQRLRYNWATELNWKFLALQRHLRNSSTCSIRKHFFHLLWLVRFHPS